MTDLSQVPGNAAPVKRLPRPRLAIHFRGTAGEFFGIWVVNILLTIITLGIFWPWAFVRNKRFFLESTVFEGSPFAYHATGGMIFRGWIIVVVIFFLVQLSGVLHPLIPVAFWVLVLPTIPWLINRGLRFQARMTSWRGVHFGFEGHYWKALIAFILAPIGTVLSLGLLFPLTTGLQARYLVNHYRFGTSKFSLSLSNWSFYRAALWLLLFNFALLVAALVIGLSFFAMHLTDVDEDVKSVGSVFGVVIPFLVFMVMATSGLFYRIIIRNLVVNAMQLDPKHRFRSELSVFEYPLKSIFGWMLVSMTFGLMYPWYKCMLWRTQCEALTVLPSRPIDGFVDDLRAASPGAFGDQAADALGIHIGI